MPSNQEWYCNLTLPFFFSGTMCSTRFITNITFERFYSIIRPHKAASFNTVKRAKITIICIVVFSIVYNSPHLFISSYSGRRCTSYVKILRMTYGQFYFWFSFTLTFVFPVVYLLIMNSVIIHIARRSRALLGRPLAQDQRGGQGQGQRMKNAEKQITVMLLLVTFVFIILSTPGCVVVYYRIYVDIRKFPYTFAGYYLFDQFAQKTYYTNYGINFFLYVISGQKFRADLLKLFNCFRLSQREISSSSELSTKFSFQDSVVKSDHIANALSTT